MAGELIQTDASVEVVQREGVDQETLAQFEDRVELTPFPYRQAWHRAFMAVFAYTGEVSSAAKAVGKNQRYIYEVKKLDPVFAAGFAEAKEVADDILVRTAWRRATVGEEVVVTRTTRKFKQEGGRQELAEEATVEERYTRRSDTLLMFMMKARMPHIYREQYDVRHTGADGGPVQVEVYQRPSPERVAELAALYAEEQGFVHPDVDGSLTNGSQAA